MTARSVRSLRRLALLAATAAVTATVAAPSCEPHEEAAGSDVDPGPTFGAEITVRVVGRGGVISRPTVGIECPSSCFERIVRDPSTVDADDMEILLFAQPSSGAHLVSFELTPLELGARARGPAQCSPMTRKSEVGNSGTSGFIAVRFGETIGTPPRGREEECAAFTKVPLAYAVTATFADDEVPAPPDSGGADAGLDPVFVTPGSGAAKEIGVTLGFAYWRYEQNGLSGIASADLSTQQAKVIVPPVDVIRLFDVDVHTVLQHSNGVLQAIQTGSNFAVTLGNAPICVALASDFGNAYCRTSGPGGGAVYAWPISGAPNPTIVHQLPPGNDLAVDDQHFYFSDDRGGLTDEAFIESAPVGGDGGVPFPSVLLTDQTSPRSLIASSSYLFWLDDRGTGVFSARSAFKIPPTGWQASVAGTSVRFLAASTNASRYFIGIAGPGFGASSILRAFPGSSASTVFRSGMTGLAGLATDGLYVYFTESGGIYRVPADDGEL